MQSEDFDKKIRDAADNHHPSYNEKAWTKMEKLLDKHLPNEKNDRRRIIFFVLLFLLLGGGTWLFISQPWKTTPALTQTATETPAGNNKPATPGTQTGQETSRTTTTTTTTTTATRENASSSSVTTGDSEHTTPHGQSPIVVKPGEQSPGTNPTDQFSVTTSAGATRARTNRQKAADDFGIVTGAPGKKKKGKTREDAGVTTLPSEVIPDAPKNNMSEEAVKKQTDLVEDGKEKQKDVMPPVADKETQKTDKKDEPAKDPVTPPAATPKKKKEKKHTETALAFTLSAGPDISYVGSRLGKWQPVVGAGLSYTFAKRFTLRTGFYTASKIYSASPEDYKPKSPPPTPQFLKLIDAKCKVYEIPVTLAYQFVKSKNSSWFAAAGLSSYIMKEEKYDYLYEYTGGSTWTYNWDLKNKNKHMFSVLSLSAGYTRNLGRTFAVSAEPYFKMPLNGVGFGKVKLNSAGVLVTLSTRLTGHRK